MQTTSVTEIDDLSFLLSEQTFVKEYNSDLRLIELHTVFFVFFQYPITSSAVK